MFILRPSSHILPFQNVVLRFSNPLFGATWRLWGPQPPKGPSVWWFGDCRLFWHCSCSPLLVTAALGQSLGHCRLPERGLLQARRELGHVEKKILCIAPSPAGEGAWTAMRGAGAGQGGAQECPHCAETWHTSCCHGFSGLAQPREGSGGPTSCPPAGSSHPSGQA